MEDMGIGRAQTMFNGAYNDRRVLITGHTGFKGSWLTFWLSQLGAKVTGYSLPPPTEPNHYTLLNPKINSITGDLRDADLLKKVFREHRPEIVFHLAAQAIVRLSYKDPVETFSSNVMGTINLFEAARTADSLRAIVNITSDKCYENREWVWGYRENDPLGGYDPYSASKGCAEIVTASYRNSFFNINEYGKQHSTLVASARAGNVIGGGDWAVDRLIPDIMRAVDRNEKVKIRNPMATRPWQHVLEPLSGYLMLGQKLLEGVTECAESWNFGPSEDGSITVGKIAEEVKKIWPKIDYEIERQPDQPHEAGMLRLDCSKARSKLHWAPVWNGEKTFEKTTQWYRSFYESSGLKSSEDLKSFIEDARDKKITWVEP